MRAEQLIDEYIGEYEPALDPSGSPVNPPKEVFKSFQDIKSKSKTSGWSYRAHKSGDNYIMTITDFRLGRGPKVLVDPSGNILSIDAWKSADGKESTPAAKGPGAEKALMKALAWDKSYRDMIRAQNVPVAGGRKKSKKKVRKRRV